PYQKPNFEKIAQSKAYRNGVLGLIPQDVAFRWKAEMLRLKKGEGISVGVLSEKRANVLRFAASHAIGLDRQALERLTLDQIAGLGDAAREGQLPAFVNAARTLNLEIGAVAERVAELSAGQSETTTQQQPPRRRGRPRNEPPQQQQEQGGGPPPGHPAA